MYIRKRTRALACTLVVALLTGGLLGTHSTYAKADADTLSSLKNQYNQLQQQQQKLQQQINKLDSQVSTEQQKKQAIDQNISVIEKQITVLKSQVATATANIDKKNADIKATEKDIATNTEEYKEQVCAIFEAGNNSTLEVLLSSKSASDFLNRIQILQDITAHDKQIISNLNRDKATLQTQKTQMQAALTDYQNSEGSLAAKNEVLNAQREQQSKVVSDLKNNENSVKKQSDEVKQKAYETDKQINEEIAKEAAARAAELAKERAAAAAAQSQPGVPQGTQPGTVSQSYLVKYAEGFIGTPYVFGSADPSVGFDCSGFVQYVYANAAGKYLPHSAAGQAGYGTAVSQSNLQPGDLVFFAVDGGGIDHVGIYVGNDEFVEANAGNNTPDEVIVTGLFSSSYWGSRYVCARRILNS